MIEDVYEPLARYRDEFRDKFAKLAQEKFEALTKASGIDVSANRRTAAQIRKLENEASSARSKMGGFGCLTACSLVVAVAGIGWFFLTEIPDQRPWGIAAAVVGFLLCILFLPAYKAAARRLEDLQARLACAKQTAWEQMEPLNRLYTWDLTVKLIQATVPRLEFDPYFTAQRLDDLARLYAWDDSFNDGKSILFAQSGVINGNPFVFGDFRDMYWGEETYHGSKTISWTEWEEDSEGRRRRVTRYETLHASVTKPKPVYQTRKFLLYGNDAAPDLVFTRKPSELSGSGDGFFARRRLRREVKKLEDFSRNLKDEYGFTIMGNREFEALFKTMTRNNEVQYRLLFTPVAQMQMLQLIKDKTVGYGDDFTFRKRRKINLITARHLDAMSLDTDPAQFRDWDWEHAREHFLAANADYFKHVFFALAPLLAIPLYQQTRTHEEIWKGVVPPGSRASFWEHEALANYHGEKKFEHPRCLTHSLLKTRVCSRADGVSEVAVTAHGYCGETRTDYESVYGGDGNWHDVPVEWIEYLPVSRTSTMSVAEGKDEAAPRAQAYRRSIYSWLAR